MDHRFSSDGIELAGELAEPERTSQETATLVLCHGYPDPTVGSVGAGLDLSELGARIASTMGWRVFTFRFRGCGTSGGNFSLGGWREDILAAVSEVSGNGIAGVWLAGFGTGGGLCVTAAAQLQGRVAGVATMAAPAGFDDWASHTRRLLQHSRQMGLIRDPTFPSSREAWAEQLRTIRPVDDAVAIADLPMLVVHGADDESVPVFDARVLADAHGTAELRIIAGAGHGLRYDPRVIAVLLGWLDRSQTRLASASND